MNIDFEILSQPKDPIGYRVIAETDARLHMVVGSSPALVLESILIVELAMFCKEWIVASGPGDFWFASMDEECEPVLAFESRGAGQYQVRSCLSEVMLGPVHREVLFGALENLLDGVDEFLLKEFKITLAGLLASYPPTSRR